MNATEARLRRLGDPVPDGDDFESRYKNKLFVNKFSEYTKYFSHEILGQLITLILFTKYY